jgi:GT2 family glycosyltransferase/thioesterase domain-containing protein/acyl carrier protein
MPIPKDLGLLRAVVPPRNNIERRLAEIWETVLKMSPIGVHDSFFDLGGDSLLSVSLMIQIETEFGKALPLSTVLTEPTIEHFARMLGPDRGEHNAPVLLRAGESRAPIFLIHDGEGEILPYRNLAFRLPLGHPVYGISPYSRSDYPMLHTRLSEVVDHYTAQILSVQPKGPYLLGGLCIGGFIAFEIARKLQNQGHQVDMVALIDAAHVKAPTRSLASQRLTRFMAAIDPGAPLLRRLRNIGSRGIHKVSNFAGYVVHSRTEKVKNWAKMKLFRYYLDHGWSVPTALRNIPVRVILRFAEKEYVVPEPYSGEVVLIRATQRDSAFDGTLIDDTPYVELFTEPLLGWSNRAAGLKIHDVPGGHSSMLQEPNVRVLADVIRSYLDHRVHEGMDVAADCHLVSHDSDQSLKMPGSNPTAIASSTTGVLAGRSAARGGKVELDIAVVIVTYKSAQLTIESLRSVQMERSTAGLRIRAVVVDNASGDLPTIAQAVEINDWSSWVTFVLAPKNGGFAYGNNLGIERAYADGPPTYIYLLNPDAQVRPDAIGSLVRFLEAHSDVGIAGSSFENVDGSDWPIAFRFPTLLSEVDGGLAFGLVTRLLRRWVVARHMGGRTPQRVDWICGASMMIRPAVIAAIGGLDENYFLYFEETDFCYRASRAGFSTWYVPESRVMHIAGQSTKVTYLPSGPKRLPDYWFESRRRYFAVSFGIGRAIVIDLVAVLAHCLGWLKRIAQRKTHTAVPYFIRDLMRHSVLRRRNRDLPALPSAHVRLTDASVKLLSRSKKCIAQY